MHDGQVGEWIKNFSLEQVLGGDTGTLSPLFDDLKLFISKVLSCSKISFVDVLIVYYLIFWYSAIGIIDGNGLVIVICVSLP